MKQPCSSSSAHRGESISDMRSTNRGESTGDKAISFPEFSPIDLPPTSIRDWLYGVRHDEPESETSAEPQTESERLRVIYHMITVPKEAGGAGISPKHGEWENVLGIFPLHDVDTNNDCMRDWSKKTFLSQEDLDQIRNTFGESVGGPAHAAMQTAGL